MNRERGLLLAVVALAALWFFLFREEAQVVSSVDAPAANLDIMAVRPPDFAPLPVKTPKPGAFTVVTNETPYPRPDLFGIQVSMPGPERGTTVRIEVPRAYGLPGIWPPTTYSVGPERMGRLRRPVAAPQEGGGGLQLPAAPAGAGEAAAGDDPEARFDRWKSNNQPREGRVERIWLGGTEVRDPGKLPDPGKEALESRFHRALCLLQLNPETALQEGVGQVEVRLWMGNRWGGTLKQRFNADITEFEVAFKGRNKGWYDGYKRYLTVSGRGGFSALQSEGKALLERGRSENDKSLMGWALLCLQEARRNVPGDAQTALREILLNSLDAATRLNRQELVLDLAFEHLSKFPEETDVLEYLGGIVGSRNYGIYAYADRLYAKAPNSAPAQRRRAAVLIKEGRLEEARRLLEGGRAGTGAETDLLTARVALALGDLDTAERRAASRTTAPTPSDAAQAHQVLGAAAYARGDAAKAEEHFLAAANADPGNSTAFSDLGLALAVQGKADDARACFARAAELDRIDNVVIPRLGEAFLRMAAGDVAGAEEQLTSLVDDNPRDLLARFFLGYAKELRGDLAGAAASYRSTLDDDHRWRMAIARLGVVQARRVEAGGDDEQAREAVGFLRKAVALNPGDGLLPYILGRFLLLRKEQPRLTDEMLQAAQEAPPAPGADADLPLWAELSRSILRYRDEAVEERAVKGDLNALRLRIEDRMPAGMTKDRLPREHEVYAAASECLAIVQETEGKVNKTWTFQSQPKDWEFNRKEPARVAAAGGQLRFSGVIDYGGQARNFIRELENCSVVYKDKDLNGGTFHELRVKGRIGEANRDVDFGVGLVNEGRGTKGPTGVQIRRKGRTGNLEMRLDGGDGQIWRDLRVEKYYEMRSVPWPAGDFELLVKVERGEQAQREGRFQVFLNGENVFAAEFPGTEGERSAVFGRARGNMQLVVYLWVEGSEGQQIEDITVGEVVLTKASENK